MAILATHFAASCVLLLVLGVLLLLALLTRDRDVDPFLSSVMIALLLIAVIISNFADPAGPASGSLVEVSTSPTDFATDDQRVIVVD